MNDLPRLMAIAPPRLDDPRGSWRELRSSWVRWVSSLGTAEPVLVQIRVRRLNAARTFDLTRTLISEFPRIPFAVNGRVDLALAAGAWGVQLPEAGLPPARVREVTGTRLRIGRSVHSIRGTERAAAEGADWVTLSPIFAPRSKQAATPPLGLETLARAAQVGIPIFALGGMDHRNRRACRDHGAWGVAGISLFAGGGEVAEASRLS